MGGDFLMPRTSHREIRNAHIGGLTLNGRIGERDGGRWKIQTGFVRLESKMAPVLVVQMPCDPNQPKRVTVDRQRDPEKERKMQGAKL